MLSGENGGCQVDKMEVTELTKWRMLSRQNGGYGVDKMEVTE